MSKRNWVVIFVVVIALAMTACAPKAGDVAKVVLESPAFQAVAADAKAARIAAEEAEASADQAKGVVETISNTLGSPLGMLALVPALPAEVPIKAGTSPVTMPTSAPVTPPVVASQPVTGTWEMVDFHPSGDKQDVVNVDHNSLSRVTIAWFFAGPANKLLAEACTIHVTTDPKGERITFLGAFRTWQWTGVSAPTKADVHQLVADWIKVLEKEPRGACATPGIYLVTWQDSNLVPSGPKGRP